jgi:hypothetical protein
MVGGEAAAAVGIAATGFATNLWMMIPARLLIGAGVTHIRPSP